MTINYEDYVLYPQSNPKSLIYNAFVIMPYIKQNIQNFNDKFDDIKQSPLFNKIKCSFPSENDAVIFCISVNISTLIYFS